MELLALAGSNPDHCGSWNSELGDGDRLSSCHKPNSSLGRGVGRRTVMSPQAPPPHPGPGNQQLGLLLPGVAGPFPVGMHKGDLIFQ